MTHENCQHNQLIGFYSRHLLNNIPEPEWLEHTENGTLFKQPKVPLPITGMTQQQVMDAAYTLAEDWVDYRKVDLIDPQTYLNKMQRSKYDKGKAFYEKMHLSNHRSFKTKCFVKADKYDEDLAKTKAPRMIQFRNPGINCCLARFMCPVEHELLTGPGLGPTKLPMCSKGMKPIERANTWLAKRSVFKRVVCMLADFSKFDSHVHTHTLGLEHYVWALTSGVSADTLSKQLINHGYGDGIEYTAVGTRMSGDRNTGGGNSIINIILTNLCSKIAGVHIEMLCDGDDSLVWMEEEDLDKFTSVAKEIIPKVFGMKWEWEVARQLHHEEYCHTRLIIREDGSPFCCPDPLRDLRRMLWTVNEDSKRHNGAILIGNCVSMLTVAPGCPIVAPCAHYILNKTQGLVHRWECGENDGYWKEQLALYDKIDNFGDAAVVSDYMRDQIDLYFGYSPGFQRFVEDAAFMGQVNPRLQFVRNNGDLSRRENRDNRVREPLMSFGNNTAYPWVDGMGRVERPKPVPTVTSYVTKSRNA